jgi:hypothetical protein
MRGRALASGVEGQASIELVALAPLLVLIALTAAHVLAAGATAELADHAAEAGAIALLQEADPRAAARDSLPDWAAERASVRVDGRRVRVRLRPPSPLLALARLLEAHGEADAGPDRAPR